MADPAENSEIVEKSAGLPEVLDDRDILRAHCAKLYGLGFKRREICRAMWEYLCPNESLSKESRMTGARSKLRRWEQQQSFRDLIYERARIALDMEMPGIFKGIAKQAKRGRVDAARLALEVTGRHTAKGDVQPTQVAVVFSGIPRPNTDVLSINGAYSEDEDQDDG